MVSTHFDIQRQIACDLGRGGRCSADPKPVSAVGNALEQEKAVEIGSRDSRDFPGTVDQLEVDAFKAQFAAFHQRSLDASAADQADLHVGWNPWPRNHDL